MSTRALFVSLALLLLSGCGAAAPASPSAAASKPAATTPATAAASASPASAKPAASGSAAAKPATSGSPAASGAVALKGAYITVSPTGAPSWVGKEMGMFARNGLDVSLTSVQATTVMPALTANEIQFAQSGAAEVASINLQGGSMVMIAEGAALPIFSLYADKKYKTVQDLAGQTIGVTSIGAASDTAAKLFLRKLGMEGKINIAAAGGSSPAILAAMSKSLIAGGILIPPVTAQAEQQGYVELVNGVKLGVPYTQGSLTVTRSFLKDRPDVANRMLKAYLEAWTYLGNPANKAGIVKVLEQYTKTDANDAEVAYNFMLPLWQSQKVPYLTKEAVANVLEFISDPKAKGADPMQFYDNGLLEKVAKEMGM